MSNGLRLEVFDPTNTTLVGEITNGIDIQFVDEFNAPGYGTVTVLLDSADAALIARDRVVRVTYQDAVRFAWVIESLDRTLVDDSNQQLMVVAGPGILSWLNDAIVYPQAGLRENYVGERPFNFAAEDGNWTQTAGFQNAQGVRWKNDTTVRQNLPARWPDPAAFWIWKTDPESKTVPAGTVNYMRKTFTLSARTRITFWATADNFFELWLDGQELMSSSRFTEDSPSFAQMTKATRVLGAGDHTLAARVRNGKPWRRTDVDVSKDDNTVKARNHGLTNGTPLRFTDIDKSDVGISTGTTYYVVNRQNNDFKVATTVGGSAVNILKDAKVDIQLREDRYAGFLCVGYAAGDDGRPDRTVAPVVRTNLTWQVTDNEPLWRPPVILRALIQEANQRGVYRFDKFSYSFNEGSPTTGTWSTSVDLTLKVGATLLDVYNEMVDLGVDIWINPETCQLSAAERRGSDKSSTVKLERAVNLLQFETSTERTLKTTALIQYRDGWTQAGNNQDTLGRRETYLEMGRTRSESTARIRARRLLGRTGKQVTLATTVEALPVEGVIPFEDFEVGDIIGIPRPDGSDQFIRARVLSLAIEGDSGNVTFQPELEVL
jgi:hypothetical protein